jgi:hypothetical protein
MDFIERWFGVSPDGGSGLTEVSYIFVFALIIVLLIRWIYRDRRRRGQNPDSLL